MNRISIKTTLGILALGAFSLHAGSALAARHPGFGHPDHARQIAERLDHQDAQIRAGRRDGSLGRMEFRELQQEQHRIRAMARTFRADDGIIDAREYRRLDHALDRASRNIRAERHDRRPAPGPRLRFD